MFDKDRNYSQKNVPLFGESLLMTSFRLSQRLIPIIFNPLFGMSAPLAERLRPRTLDDYIGQEHLVGGNGVFRKFLETGNVPSFILWGPPGVGKTTLAKIVATELKRPFFTLSAVTSGVKDVREVIESARKQHLSLIHI